jgi:adenine-specific DNA-methyltransferase
MDKLKMQSPNLVDANIEKIAEIFPNCITEAKDENGMIRRVVDFDQLRQELSASLVESPRERYTLSWPGKNEAILTANAPIAKTLRPCVEESVDFENTKNIYIEGDNLDALKLLQETYLNKVKMIYIDPPYNTGNDFIYEDDFAEDTEAFLIRSNQKDEQGNRLIANTEANGRFHSDWLTMMYPRLKLARNLLRDDGVLFVSLDENEQHNLKICLNEVFGENNFVCEFIWKNKHGGGGDSPYAVKEHEYVFCYSKNITSLPELFAVPPPNYEKMFREEDGRGKFYYDRLDKKGIDANRPNLIYPIECPDGTEKDISPAIWRLSEEEFLRRKEENEIGFRKDKNGEWQVYTKTYLCDENGYKRRVKARSILKQEIVGFTQNGNKEIVKILGGKYLQNPKPISLIKYLLDFICRDKNDIILDFFSGSATTAHAVMQLNAEDGGNRKFIMVQLPEPCDEKSEAYKAGYKTIAEIGKERIRRAGKKVKEESPITTTNLDIGFRVFKVDTSNMKDVYYTPDELKQDNLELFKDHIKPDRRPEDLLFQVFLDWGLDLTLPIAKETIDGKTVFIVDTNALVACFDSGITEELVKKLAKYKPLRVVFRDDAFGSDSVKINVEQIFRLLSPTTEVKSI